MRKVAIIGLGPGAEDAPEDWERWGLPWSRDYGLDMYFDPHEGWRDLSYYGNDPVDFLSDFFAPIMMLEVDSDVKTSQRFPIEAVKEEVGEYLECSISYALAYAIMQRVPTIGLYGISGDDGYISQRPNLEYLIGYARGLGIAVHVGPKSKLLKSEFKAGRYGPGDMSLKD